MSIDATRWAWTRALTPSRKLVLLSLADRADEHHRCYPSIARLVADTGLDRKTIMESIAAMEAAGLLAVSRQNGAGSVYQLLGIEDRGNPSQKRDQSQKRDPSQKRDSTSPKNGTATSTKNGTVNLPLNLPITINPPLPPQSPAKPRRERAMKSGGALAVELPDCIAADTWARWVAHRQALRKPLTRTTAEAQVRQLCAWAESGHDPNAILATSICNSWQGIFEPKTRGGNHAAAERVDNSAPARVARALAERDARRAAEGSGVADGAVVEGEFTRVPL